MASQRRFRSIVWAEKIARVVEGHEDEDESFQKTFDLLGRVPALAGLYVNTVNCLPVCRALGARNLAGKIKLITTDLFAEMAPSFRKGIITASIYQQPHRQGQIAVRIMADSLTSRVPLPPIIHLSPGVVMSSNLPLFREIRHAETKLDDSILQVPSEARELGFAAHTETGRAQFGYLRMGAVSAPPSRLVLNCGLVQKAISSGLKALTAAP